MTTDEHLYDLTRPFGELTDEERGALMRAHLARKPIELHIRGLGFYRSTIMPCWTPHTIYRLARPALVMPTMDWTPIRPEWRYCAADENGKAYLYTHRPQPGNHEWQYNGGNMGRIDHILTSYNRGTVPWQKSLIIRPEGV